MTKLLDEPEIREHLASVPRWERRGSQIVRTFEHKDFVAATGFVVAVAVLAERADHHPDIDIRWNKVTLTLTTHSAGGLTGMDFALARSIDAL
ncbi:MAG: 4a-hydroxytetrahydrobiopterin dehydratase [Bacteroidetes bacterium]|nr:4a-hydroxytetrahydrobiopterin dehydratase [Bacteroidota bacterium]